LVDTSWCDSGGSCDFLPIRGHKDLGFKNFKNKAKAKTAWSFQSKLSKFNLAPKLYSGICKIPYSYDLELLKYWNPKDTVTEWGFVTQKAEMLDETDQPLIKLQNLVDAIYKHTSIKFWDCHWTNVGYIKHRGRNKLVCIDTGEESFQGYANAWGYEEPGPKCPYCNVYACECATIYSS
jgi:hypothetical protein